MNNKFKFSGYTIIEVLAVMVIGAILSALVLPKFGGRKTLQHAEVISYAHQITTDLRYARRLAINDGNKNYQVQFNLLSRTYAIYSVDSFGATTQIGETRTIAPDLYLSIIDGDFGTNSFTFTPLGAALRGGILQLKDAIFGYKSIASLTVFSTTGAVNVDYQGVGCSDSGKYL